MSLSDRQPAPASALDMASRQRAISVSEFFLIDSGELPTITLPVRSLDNVKYDEATGYFELGDASKARTLTVHTARPFAQTLRLMATSRQIVEQDDFATKREVYYISKNWGECRFDEQAESDAIMC